MSRMTFNALLRCGKNTQWKCSLFNFNQINESHAFMPCIWFNQQTCDFHRKSFGKTFLHSTQLSTVTDFHMEKSTRQQAVFTFAQNRSPRTYITFRCWLWCVWQTFQRRLIKGERNAWRENERSAKPPHINGTNSLIAYNLCLSFVPD